MTIETQIKLHERCLEILQAIQSLKVRRQCNRDSLNGFQGTFPSLRRRLENNIDTLDKCIIKLNNKYQNIN
jgi:septation ring formation regulator EzrA